MQTEDSKPKILIADDCEDARALLALALDGEGYDLKQCGDGSEVLVQLGEHTAEEFPELIILDVQMPGATGIEVCQWIKQNAGDVFVPVILLTSQAELADRVNGLNCGADEYITKPFAIPELLARVNALLRIKSLADRLRNTEHKLAESERKLVAAQVAGAAAHQLGQPLTAVLLNAELLGQLPADSPKFRTALETITQDCNAMRDVLRQLDDVEEYKTTQYIGDTRILDLGDKS